MLGLFGVFDILYGLTLALWVMVYFAIYLEDLNAEAELFRGDRLLWDGFTIIFLHGNDNQR